MTTTRTDTLPALLDGLVAANPDAPIAYDIVDDVAVARSRGEFRDRVEAVRCELDGIGLRAGQCIAVMLPNWSDALVWQFAASALGAHVIGVNTRYNTREVAHILTAARPAVVAVPAMRLGGVALALFDRVQLADDATVAPAGDGFRAVTLAHNVASEAEVDAALAHAESSGARIVKPAAKVFWGGYSGYFSDPDGHLWEVAHNPFITLDSQGRLVLPGPEETP